MSKKLNRKKPGYTKSGDVKIVSLNYKQLSEMISKVSKKKIEAKIRNRMNKLERHPDFVAPVQEQSASA